MASANISPIRPAGSPAIEPAPSKGLLWTGRIISAVVVLFMTFGFIMGLANPKMSAEGMAHLGYAANLGMPISILMLTCTLLYAIPRTTVLGVLLLTAYLGGATASHLRIGEPWFFPVIVGTLAWAGLLLRKHGLLGILSKSAVAPESKGALWSGRILGILLVLSLLMDGGVKFTTVAAVTDAFTHLGYPLALAAIIGTLELICTVLYAIPRTSALGAVLLTGFLGGATAIKLRAGDQVFFAVIFGVLVWGALWLQDRRIRALIPVVSQS